MVVTQSVLNKNIVNDHFFRMDTPDGFVLGIIYTDGNIRPSILKATNAKDTIRTSRLTIAQKKPELLQGLIL